MRGDGAQRRCRFEARAAAAPDGARSAVSDENQNRSARIVRVVCLRLLLVPCDNADLGRRRCCFDGSARLMSIRAAASTGWSRTTAQPGEGPSPTRARQHGSFSSGPATSFARVVTAASIGEVLAAFEASGRRRSIRLCCSSPIGRVTTAGSTATPGLRPFRQRRRGRRRLLHPRIATAARLPADRAVCPQTGGVKSIFLHRRRFKERAPEPPGLTSPVGTGLSGDYRTGPHEGGRGLFSGTFPTPSKALTLRGTSQPPRAMAGSHRQRPGSPFVRHRSPGTRMRTRLSDPRGWRSFRSRGFATFPAAGWGKGPACGRRRRHQMTG